MTRYVLLDTETTGIIRATKEQPEEKPGELIQLAYEVNESWKDPIHGQDGMIAEERYSKHYLVPKDIEMEIEAMVVTQLTPRWLSEHAQNTFKDDHTEVKNRLVDLGREPDVVFVAHNAEFDRRVLEQYGITTPRWICTKKVAQAWHDFDSYGLQYLRYKLDKKGKYHYIRFNAHDAMQDVQCLALVFELLVSHKMWSIPPELALEEMERVTNEPAIVRRMPFGAHRGKLLTEIPKDYLAWAIANIKDMSADLAHSINAVINPNGTLPLNQSKP